MSAIDALLKSELDLAWQHIFKRDTSAAMAHAKKASTIANESPDVAHVLGVIASRDGRPDLALPLLQKALNAGITERRLRDMAEALVLAKHPQAALTPIQDAIKQFGESSESLGLLAGIYVALEKFDDASRTAQKAVALKPSALTWETTIAFCDLIRGQCNEGLNAFTFRPQTMADNGRCPALHLATPGDLWLKNEQGPGDTLFFLCHAPALVARGWRLHVQSHIRTQKLLEQTGLFADVSLAFNCPKDGFWINIGDLPLAATQLALPAVAKPMPIKAQEKLVGKMAKLLQKFGPPPYIAVTWRGGVQGSKVRNGVRMGDRYIDTHLLGQTLKDTNATVISVQRVPDAKEAKAFEAGLGRKYLDLSRLNDNLPEMMALMELVHEYIAVPNTNHHLREAIGKPSKIIVNRPYEDWRWAHEGNSLWYPNATCYRQSEDGNLKSVFQQIKQDLVSALGSIQPTNTLRVSDEMSVLEENDTTETQVMELLQAGWKAVGTNEVAKAIQYAQQVITIAPNNSGAYHLLGWAAMRDLKVDLAVSVLKRACELDNKDGRIVGDYIRALSVNQKHSLAIEVATNALNNPSTDNLSSIHYGRAACYLSINKINEAIQDYQSCMRINPNRLDAQEYSGMARLKLGQAVKGFRELTARKVAQRDELLNDWCCPILTPNHKGSRILIKRDMGLGDELTYLRYLPWLTAAGMQVDYWAGKKLVPLLSRMGYLNQVYPDSKKAPDSCTYDLSLIVNDLPVAAHGLGAPEIAPPLPLSPRPDLVEKWQAWLQTLGNGPYIGLNWKAGMGAHGVGNIFSKLAKAVDAEPFAKALTSIDATWISLQRNVLKDELDQFEQHLQAPLHDASSLTDDIEDLLALLSLLDENIGVSNTNMHLRASLGLASRVMVQTPGGDWRWGVEGDTSVWFTQSKVYRQTLTGEWDATLQVLQTDLQAQYGHRVKSESSTESTKLVPFSNTNSNQTKRLIWLTAGAIKNVDGKQTSELASARYRVIAPSIGLAEFGWQSEIVNEELSQVMGGWGSAVPKVGDVLIVSKVLTNHAINLTKDAKSRGAKIVFDIRDNFLSDKKRGGLQKQLIELSDQVTTASNEISNEVSKLSDKPVVTIFDLTSEQDASEITQQWNNCLEATFNSTTYQSNNSNCSISMSLKKNPKVLVGVMYSGENEYEDSISALQHQSYKHQEMFAIENLPNKLAHDTLYSKFMDQANGYDYFLKLDADMVFAHQDALKEMVEVMQEQNLAHMFAYVKDCPSGILIPGIQMFKSDTMWTGSDEQLNVDYAPKVNGKSETYYNKDWINHMPNPDEYQLFRYGVHKALKSIQPDRTTKNIKKGILHLTILNGIARNLKNNEKHWFALIGALLVYKKAFDSIEYNGEQTKKYFDILKNKPEKFQALKENAAVFWSNEVQVNYWWVENFSKFSLSS